MFNYLSIIGIIFFASCSFVTIEHVASDGDVGYLQERNCSEYVFGFRIKNNMSTPVLLTSSSIDKITMIEHELYFPLIPVYLSSCYLITGNAAHSLEDRLKRQNLMSTRNDEFNNKDKKD